MIKKIFNWTIGSFFRTLGRILVYLFIGFLISMIISKSNIKLPSLFNILEVDAMQVGGVDYYMPSDVKLYNNLSQTSSNLVGTSYITGSNLGTNSQIAYYYGTVSTTTGGYGASWCINAPFTFMNGYIYNVQIVVDNDNNREFNIVSNNNYDMLRLGYSASNASTHSDTTSINFFGAIYDSSGVYIESEAVTTSGVYVLTYLFTSKLNSQFICLPFKHTTNSSNEIEYFYGAKFDIVGQANLVTNASLNSAISNSGLASASSVAQVQSSLNEVQQEVAGTQSAVQDQTDTMTNSNTNDAKNDASNFFSNFSTNTHGLTGIITAPLNAIQSLTSSNCSDLTIPIPFLTSKNLVLPCMRPIYQQYFGGFMTLYDIITLGIVSYWVMVRIFGLVKDFKNPEHDEIEVVDL